MHEIYLTGPDKEKLRKTVNDAIKNGEAREASMRDLLDEISQSTVLAPQDIPKDVVTMNSRAVLHIDGEDLEFDLVYPEAADLARGKLSVLSPIGTAILGYRAGDTVEWDVPSGKAKIKIKKVLYQPEAAGDYNN